jgi:hypothetical protein
MTQFLVPTIDEHLNWNEHFNNVKNIYFAYIHSHISFGYFLFRAAKKGKFENYIETAEEANNNNAEMKLKHDDSAKILIVYG